MSFDVLHQSYEDFQLDALIQYDLADADDDDNTNNEIYLRTIIDEFSIHSDIMEDEEFDELYASTEFDVTDIYQSGRRPRLQEAKKKILSSHRMVRRRNSNRDILCHNDFEGSRPIRRHSIGGMECYNTVQTTKSKKNNNDGISNTFRSMKRIFQRKVDMKKHNNMKTRSGVHRTTSNRTEGTIIIYDDVSDSDDMNDRKIEKHIDHSSSSVCYLDDEADDDDDPIVSIHDIGDDSEVFADEHCVDTMHDDDSVSTISDGHCLPEDPFMRHDIGTPKFNRSLPIIDVKSLESLYTLDTISPPKKSNKMKMQQRRSMSHIPYMQGSF